MPSAGTSLRLLPDLASFAALLLMAWLAAWTPGELAWGLWTSSFLMVAVWLVIMAVLLVKQDGFGVLKTGGVLLAVALTGWALVWVYRFYGELLDFGFPLLPDPGRVHVRDNTWRNVRAFALWPTLVAGVQQFYAVIILSLLPLIPGLRRTWPDPDKFRMDPGFTGVSFVCLHFTVMALMFLQMVLGNPSEDSARVMSSAVLTINYFPWQVLASRSRESGGADYRRG